MVSECIISVVLNSKGYGVEWRDIVRPSVLKRDKYKCRHCGVSNRVKYTLVGNKRVILDDDWLLKQYTLSNHKIYNVVLQVAHECNTKACCNEAHLITLCSSCHLVKDKHIHLINRLINAANKKKLQ
jgi:5-methylcytosine-specific restriction endonuclease McrA